MVRHQERGGGATVSRGGKHVKTEDWTLAVGVTCKARTDLGSRVTRDTAPPRDRAGKDLSPGLNIISVSHDSDQHSPWRHPGREEGLSDPELAGHPHHLPGNGDCGLHQARHPHHLHLGLAWHLVTRGNLGTCNMDGVTTNV